MSHQHGNAFTGNDATQSTDDDDNYIENLPINAKRTVQGIRGIEAAQTNIRKEFQKEVMALERKYATKYQHLYDRRKRVISGEVGVSKDEVAVGEEQSQKEDDDYERLPSLNSSSVHPTSLDGFWLRALKTHPDILDMIQESDEDALKHLTDITLTYPNVPLSFAINFYFSRNEFFTNSVLTKTYVYKDELSFYGSFLYSHVNGDTIHWKKGKNLINLAKEQAKNEEKDNGDDDDDDDDDNNTESFFTFFEPSSLITVPEDEESANQGEGEEEDRDDLLDDDFDIGEALKERIIPRAVDYFTRDAIFYEDDDYFESDEEGDEEGDGEDDGDDDEDDE